MIQVCNGNACIASLLDAAERLPDLFTAPESQYARLLPDFVYFGQVNAFEAAIDADDVGLVVLLLLWPVG